MTKLALFMAFLMVPFANAADSYRINNGSYDDIDEFGTCARITNNHSSGSAIMVPTKTSSEWSTFRSNRPSGVTTAACPDPCETGAVGTVCTTDGAIYAGTVSSKRIYAAPTDSASGILWGHDNTTTGATSTSNGLSNTNKLVALNDSGAPYDAAKTCRAKGSDWYLPARTELETMYSNRSAIGGFNASGAFYWTSYEYDYGSIWVIRFDTGAMDYSYKYATGRRTRCIRQ